MRSITAIVVRHPVPAYFALTFGISWGGALVAIGGFAGMSGTPPTSDPRFVYAVVAMLAGPSITGILLTGLVEGRNGLRRLLSRALEWRVAAQWHVAALVMAPLLWVVTLLALALTSWNASPGIIASTDTRDLVTFGVSIALGVGIFEELGWTGFAIPHVRRRYGVFATGLIVGVVWGAWHLLTNVFGASRVMAGDLPLSIFLPASVIGVLIGYLVAFRILMVWVYDRTGSLLLAMLMHASLTASVLILDPPALSGVALLTYSLALAATVWGAVALVAARNGWDWGPATGSKRGSRSVSAGMDTLPKEAT